MLESPWHIIPFKCNFIKDVMEPDNELKQSEGQNDPEVFTMNQHKDKSTLDHPKVIIGFPIKVAG